MDFLTLIFVVIVSLGICFLSNEIDTILVILGWKLLVILAPSLVMFMEIFVVRSPKTENRKPKSENEKPKTEVRSPNISFSDINRTEPKKITDNRKPKNRTVWTSKNRTARFSVRFCPTTEPNHGLLTPIFYTNWFNFFLN